MLDEKRTDLFEIVRQCMEETHTKAAMCIETKTISEKGDEYYGQMQEKIKAQQSLALLDGYIQQMLTYKDNACERIEAFTAPKSNPTPEVKPVAAVGSKPKKTLKPVYRQFAFPTKRIETEAELDAYLNGIRKHLSELMKNSDGIEIK